MIPQERQLVAELFDRLAALESTPRDADAERTIAEGLQRAPHAAYALVQTVLVQDEALKRAHARIQELEGRPPEQQQESRGFLDNMRDTLFGRDDRRGSVPPVRPGGAGTSGVWGQPAGAPPAAGFGPGMGPAIGMGPVGGGPIGSGGSFLGTAAASAAGVIGGAMLLNGIRSMFGPHYGGAAAFGPDAAGASPWGGSAASSDLARQAGINDIGRPGRDDDVSGGRGGDDDASGGRAGLFGGDDQDDNNDNGNNDDDSDFAGDFGGDDTDTA